VKIHSRYRNHGADFSPALAGLEVPEEEHENFQAFMKSLGHPYVCDPDSTAYCLFLR
jgi:threonine dehydratase